CSTRTLPSLGNTRSTRPCLPLSRPLNTFTVSLRRISTRLCAVVAVAPITYFLVIPNRFSGEESASLALGPTEPRARAKQSSKIFSREALSRPARTRAFPPARQLH